QRSVRYLGSTIHHSCRFLEDVEVLAECFPTEVEPFREHDLGYVFDPFHQVNEISFATGANWRESHPAITEDRRRHTVPRRGRHSRVPSSLTVIVRVYVYPPRRYQQTLCIHFTVRTAGIWFELRNQSIVDCDIYLAG